MTHDNLTPNLNKLLTQYIAREAIPPGGGVESGIAFLLDADKRKKGVQDAMQKMYIAIETLRSYYPDKTDEAIAGMLLEKILERKRDQRRDK